jgi:HEAT repeat protein
MVHYCRVCWAENGSAAQRCASCGAVLEPAESYDAALVAALTHPEPTTPVRAAWILGTRRSAMAVESLRTVLRRSSDPYLLEAACTALYQIGAVAAEPELLATLRSGPLIVRHAAAAALGAIGTPAARSALA